MLASLISQGMVVGCWLGDCVGMSGGLWPMVHAIPSGLVITRFPVPSIETATKRPFPQVTLDHWLSAALAWLLHDMPAFPDVWTLFPSPVFATATNVPFPNVTDCQSLSEALTRLVHDTASALVITRLPVPVYETVTNTLFPNVTLIQRFTTGGVEADQVTPLLDDLMIRCSAPPEPTATKVLPKYTRLTQATTVLGLVRFSHSIPSLDVITRFPPLVATATKVPSPYATPLQALSAAL